jgi:hypothetical protein
VAIPALAMMPLAGEAANAFLHGVGRLRWSDYSDRPLPAVDVQSKLLGFSHRIVVQRHGKVARRSERL